MAGSKRPESPTREAESRAEAVARVSSLSARVQDTYLNSLKAQRESASSLAQRYEKATSSYREAVQALQKDLYDQGASATQTLAESVQKAAVPEDAQRRYAEVWKSYLEVLTEEWTAAQKATEESYRQFLAETAHATGLDDPRVSTAYARYADGMQTIWTSGPGPSRARQAYQTLLSRLHELHQGARTQTDDAMRKYTDAIQQAWTQPDLQKRWQDISQEYIGELTAIWKAAIEDHKQRSLDVLKGLQTAVEEF